MTQAGGGRALMRPVPACRLDSLADWRGGNADVRGGGRAVPLDRSGFADGTASEGRARLAAGRCDGWSGDLESRGACLDAADGVGATARYAGQQAHRSVLELATQWRHLAATCGPASREHVRGGPADVH